MKKVLMLNGDPHEKGCTYTALRELERALQKHESGRKFIGLAKRLSPAALPAADAAKRGDAYLRTA